MILYYNTFIIHRAEGDRIYCAKIHCNIKFIIEFVIKIEIANF